MWGIASGNKYLEGLGKLQVGVVTRSINEYFLMKDGNTNHPADFVKNKVSVATRPVSRTTEDRCSGQVCTFFGFIRRLVM